MLSLWLVLLLNVTIVSQLFIQLSSLFILLLLSVLSASNGCLDPVLHFILRFPKANSICINTVDPKRRIYRRKYL